VWSWKISSGCEDLRIVKEFHRQFFFLLHLRDGCGLLDPFGDFPSATNNIRPTQGGAAAAARRRHGLKVEDEGLLKDFIVIFVFLGALYFLLFLLMPESYSQKKIFKQSANIFYGESPAVHSTDYLFEEKKNRKKKAQHVKSFSNNTTSQPGAWTRGLITSSPSSPSTCSFPSGFCRTVINRMPATGFRASYTLMAPHARDWPIVAATSRPGPRAGRPSSGLLFLPGV
jgi:hypothetical protein